MPGKRRADLEEFRVRLPSLHIRVMRLIKEMDPMHPSMNMQIRSAVEAYIKPHQAEMLGVSVEELEG